MNKTTPFCKKTQSFTRDFASADAGDVILSVKKQKVTKEFFDAAKKKLWLRRSFRSPLTVYEGPFKNCTVRQFGALRLYETLPYSYPLAAAAVG